LVSPATIYRGKNESYDKYVYNDEKGFTLLWSYVAHIQNNGGYAVLETIIIDKNNQPINNVSINFLAQDIEEIYDGDERIINEVSINEIIRGNTEVMVNKIPNDYVDDMYLESTIIGMYCYRDQDNDQMTNKPVPTTVDHLYALGEFPVDPPVHTVLRGRKRTKRIESQSTT
jgi:hypothetical protein